VQKVVRIGTRIVLSIFAILALLALGAGWVWLSTEKEEVAFQSGDITIRGTLLSPRFGREAPGVVLVHGSGQTSRNSTMLYAWIFASLGYAALALLQGQPKTINSSGSAMRSFCPDCGTGLFYRNAVILPGIVDVQSATLDDPDALPPGVQIQVAERLHWMTQAHELPAFERFPG